MLYNLFQENQNLKYSHPLESTKINLTRFSMTFILHSWVGNNVSTTGESLIEKRKVAYLNMIKSFDQQSCHRSRSLSSLSQKQKRYIQNARTVTGPLWCETNAYLKQYNNFSWYIWTNISTIFEFEKKTD